MGTASKITLGRVSDTRAAAQTVRYQESLRVPWYWWPPSFLPATLVAATFARGVRAIPAWVPYVAFFAVAVVALLWLGRYSVKVVQTVGGDTELWVGAAHLPASVIARAAEVPKSAKSAALGRQLDPAAYVVHRVWVGPMILVVLDDPDDPTPYWLVSCRHPDRVLAALRA